MKKFKILSTILNAFFPVTCVSCGDIISEGDNLCDFCHEMLKMCNPIKRCIKCGLEKGNCDCKKYVYHFEGCVAPFYNNGVARKSVYNFKFRRKTANSDFLASSISLTVRNEFREIKFDGVCYVPLATKKLMKRGFNQSRILAKKISEILGLPLLDNALIADFSTTSQHQLSFKDRFKNVKGLYKWNYKIPGRTLLLIDDIKTTGATLDECAKQLLLSGADSVYCAVALITDNKNERIC